MRIANRRVSTTDQNLDAHRDALQAAGCAEVLVDRLGRSLEHLIVLSRDLQEGASTWW